MTIKKLEIICDCGFFGLDVDDINVDPENLIELCDMKKISIIRRILYSEVDTAKSIRFAQRFG